MGRAELPKQLFILRADAPKKSGRFIFSSFFMPGRDESLISVMFDVSLLKTAAYKARGRITSVIITGRHRMRSTHAPQAQAGRLVAIFSTSSA